MAKERDLLRTITFITGNQHKVKEARGICQLFNIKVDNYNLGYPEIQGELDDVARYGASYAAEKLQKPVIVEDAGLFIKSLGWFPGTYSSYVQDTIGNPGILKLMENVQDRYAEFRSVIGFQKPKTEPEIFLGIVKGQIALEELGNNGFAFDPIFVPQGYEETFGQLTSDIKNQFSHRRKSLEKFAIYYKDTKGD